MKRISVFVSIFLTISILFSSAIGSAQGATVSSTNSVISLADLQLITSDFVMSNINVMPTCTWNTGMRAKESPLYGADDTIHAYYVAFNNADGTPNGYLVVNASADNPSVLEYAFGTKHDDVSGSIKTYYATLGIYLTKDVDKLTNQAVFKYRGNTFDSVKDASAQINKAWKGINTKNDTAISKLQTMKSVSEKSPSLQSNAITPLSTDSWGISTSLPSGTWSDVDTLTSCAVAAPYYKTSEFTGTNNCGSTAAMNVLKYYGARLSSSFVKPDKTSAYNYLYTHTGNGGLTLPGTLLSALTSYIKDRKSSGSLSSSVKITTYQYTDNYYNNMKSCVNNGRMPLTNIWSGLQSHWINIMAYYLYSNGNCYVRITDNWNGDISRYYTFQTAYEINPLIGALIAVKITK